MTNTVPSAFTSFGELLKYLRRRARLTQGELGIAVGYSAGHVARLEAGKRLPDIMIVKAQFIEALGLVREPELASRLIELADVTNTEPPQQPKATLHAPHNLPVQLTNFIGRGQEASQVQHLLPTTRLLTLTGSGGVGKTRLAIEVAAHCALESETHAEASALTYPDGVWLVELAPITDPALVADTVALALGLHAATRSAQAMLVDHLRDKTLLLLLDNCEHLIGACAVFVEALLRTCLNLRVLATSREGLFIPGETRWRVPPLATDEAVQLFAAHARAAQPGFTLTEHNASLIARLCERLDGIPLAIELAAARLHVFSVEQIAARLDDRFRLLTGGSRTALPRHQTLKALIDWSYDLLPDEERALLRRLAVFAGGWTLDAAEAVAEPLEGSADVFDLLAQLVSKSLVQTVPTSSGFRYMMLEMIRQYASEKLAQAKRYAITQVRAKHLTFYYQLALNSKWRRGREIEEKGHVARMIHEIPNICAAIEWAIESGSWRIGIELTAFLAEEYGDTVHLSLNVPIGYVERMLRSETVIDENTRGRIFGAKAHSLRRKGNIVGGMAWFQRALELMHRTEDAYMIYELELFISCANPDYDQAIATLERIRNDAHGTGEIRHEIDANHFMGYRMSLEGHYQEAVEALVQADHFSQRNMDYSRPEIQWRLGQVYLVQGDYACARSALELAIALARDNKQHTYVMMVDLGTVGVYTGDFDIARRALIECLDWQYSQDEMERLAQVLVLGAGLAHVLGNLGTAAQLLGATAAICKIHHTLGITERELFLEYDRRLPAVRDAMESEAFERAWEVGQGLSLKHAMALAMAS